MIRNTEIGGSFFSLVCLVFLFSLFYQVICFHQALLVGKFRALGKSIRNP